MFSSEIKLRVRYAETDKMGFVYYGNYAQYFEVGRVEALRELGFRYKDLEDQGIHLPVMNMRVDFKRPARYDDELTVKTTIKDLPTAKIHFDYEVWNHEDGLICIGETDLVYVDAASGKPMRAPDNIILALKQFIQ